MLCSKTRAHPTKLIDLSSADLDQVRGGMTGMETALIGACVPAAVLIGGAIIGHMMSGPQA
jgi:hypothetical protein